MTVPAQRQHELMRLACEDAFLPYLRQVLEQNPPDRHAQIQAQFAAHMDFLANFCLRGYPGAGGLTVEFIKGLHRAMFPPNYRQEIATRDGHKVWMVPGEFKSVSNNFCEDTAAPGSVVLFMAPENVSATMDKLVARINVDMSQVANVGAQCAAVLWFILDFLTIHPFVDGNSRLACILADLLAIRAGLPPFHFHAIKHRAKFELYGALHGMRAVRELSPMMALLEAHEWPGLRQLRSVAHGG